MASVTSMKTVILLMGRKKLMTGTIFVHLHRAKFSVKKTFPPTLSHQFSGQRCTQWCGCPWPHTKPYGCSSKSTVPFGLYTPCLFCISVPRSSIFGCVEEKRSAGTPHSNRLLTSSLELHRHLDYLIIISNRCVVHPSQAVRGSECSFSSPRFRDHLFPSKGLEGNLKLGLVLIG